METQSLPTHWMSFVNNTDYYCTDLLVGPMVWGIFSVPCALVGLPASMWLLWVLIQRQCSGLSNDIYMLNLTMMDFIFNVSITPTTLNYFFQQNDLVLKLTKILYCFNIGGRPVIMACICVDCYTAVDFPISYRRMKNSRHRIVACALAWGLTLLYGAMFALYFDIFSTSLAVISYALSLPVIVLCDITILCALRKPDPSGRNNVHPQKQKAMQTITNSLVMTLVAYLPPLVVHGVSSVIPLRSQEILCNLSIPTLTFPMLGSTILPLLYLGNLGNFKNFKGFRCY